MKRLEVTDEQYAFIQQLREAMSQEVVGQYGFVRERDAVQFLIDNLDADGGVELEAEVDSIATDDVAASVDAAINDEPDPNALEHTRAVSFDETGADEADDDDGGGGGDDTTGDADDAVDDAEGDTTDADESDDDDDSGGDGAGSEAAGDDAAGSDDDATDDDAGDGDGAADDDDMLNQMMNLLDTHDDKWEESPSADYRYRVTMPDGTTEDVQTKDDVRALLFKNY